MTLSSSSSSSSSVTHKAPVSPLVPKLDYFILNSWHPSLILPGSRYSMSTRQRSSLLPLCPRRDYHGALYGKFMHVLPTSTLAVLCRWYMAGEASVTKSVSEERQKQVVAVGCVNL
ncbi:hypothetical protein E2C01_069187 [Portunus trituberculatus]|uniref:Uncharacterized protein n=1 Tax=Portunus trituberculatus TaxID=210409 RepID=A0A5B7HPF1_PORTR|nr:hypothetical protein [Portunus trituberculatus]